MSMKRLPRGILFDLDETILQAFTWSRQNWTLIAEEYTAALSPWRPAEIAAAIHDHGLRFWSDPAENLAWRTRLGEARRKITRDCFAALEPRAGPRLTPDLALALADCFTARTDSEMALYPGALATLDRLRQLDIRLALVTNGAAEVQRAKLHRFALTERFEHIQIEGEQGFGKPEPRAYRHAMAALGVTPPETWMVGDNLEWEIAAPQRLGIFAIWYDGAGAGLPEGCRIVPDRIICSLPELI